MGQVPEMLKVSFPRPRAAAWFGQVMRHLGFQAHEENPTTIVVFVPPLTAEEQRAFGVRDEYALVDMISTRAIAETRTGTAARRP